MKIKLLLCFLCSLILGIIGCNLFNPTESANIDSSDSKALTYEGYLRFRANEYSEAAYFFSKAIEADSSHSEAWYGLAKAKVNQLEINTFELLKYINVDEKSALPIAGMDDATADKFHNSITLVQDFLAEFITRDTTGKLDGVITYDNVYKDAMLLDLVQFMLSLRDWIPFVAKCQEKDPVTGLADCSIGDILNGITPENATEVLTYAHGFAKTCAEKPDVGSTALSTLMPGLAAALSTEGKNTITSTTCNMIAEKTKPSEDPIENAQGLNMLSAISNTSPMGDEDGDGCNDEEIMDDRDNDGDGEIDEDIRDVTAETSFDPYGMARDLAWSNTAKMRVRSVSPNGKYFSVDIDMDGQNANDEEWDFILADYNQREMYGDHRFKFAAKLTFNPKGLPLEEFKRLKHDVAGDMYGTKYNLEFRKENIGGCWVRYSEDDFQKMLEEQRARYGL
ncbi:MAG: hypothetical protein IJ909_11040 [Fibrobacter sp.]|nr:hypothetical protein [Fibrobacter sp.]